jgi:hypothetical protein
MTVLRHGSTEVRHEPALYEGYARFREIVDILRQKYGGHVAALRRLVCGSFRPGVGTLESPESHLEGDLPRPELTIPLLKDETSQTLPAVSEDKPTLPKDSP